jgi:hypothetical protein
MSGLGKLDSKTKIIAAIAIFSALYTALRAIPTLPMIGAPGASFSLSDVIAPVYGIILGPYIGGASVIIGTFAAMGLGRVPAFFGLDFLPALVNAVALGFLVRRKWWPVVALNALLLVAFVINPLTLNFIATPVGVFPFVWLHIIAFVVLLSPLGRNAGQWLNDSKPLKVTVGFIIMAFIGTMMQHLTGNILTEVVRVQLAQVTSAEMLTTIIWPSVFIAYPWERLALIILAVVVGVPLYKVLKKTFLAPEKKQICISPK